jgi:two-component system, NarL family, sensor kinase
MTRHNPLTAAADDIPIGVPFAAVGVLVARRQPGNAIGWLMISTAMCALLYADAGFYAVFDYRLGHGLPFGPAAVLLYQGWLPTIASVPLVILLFPDGRLPSPRWRWVLWSYLGLVCVYLAVLTAQAAAVILAGRIQVDSNGQLTVFDRSSGWLSDVRDLLLVGFIAFWLLFVGYQALSWRRSSGERRQQLKWQALEPAHASVWIKQP